MNILETVLSYDGYERMDDIDVSPSAITSKSNYQRWLQKIGREETYKLPLVTGVNSFIGTAVHAYAEKILKEDVDFKGYSELQLKGTIAGYEVGGTADVVYSYNDTYVIGDFKTLGVYQFKKASREEFKSYIPQLSIYSYLYSQSMGIEYSRLGELYLVLTGDAGYFRKDEGGGKTPKYLTETIELLNKEEVERLVTDKMKAIEEEPEVDCEEWQCSYCEFDCEFRQ